MPSCLGLYVETNLIKYAKVTKDKDLIKVEAFGVKFYDKIGEAIEQIVSETFSYKAPISINLSDEASFKKSSPVKPLLLKWFMGGKLQLYHPLSSSTSLSFSRFKLLTSSIRLGSLFISSVVSFMYIKVLG